MIVTLQKITKGQNFGARHEKTGELLKSYDDCKHTYTVPINAKGSTVNTTVYHTGLSEKEQEEFEQKLGYKKGTLSPTNKYWVGFSINIPSGGTEIDTDSVVGQLQYKVLKGDPRVVIGKEQERKNASALYVVYEPIEEAKLKIADRGDKIKAWSLYAKLSDTDIVNVLYMFRLNPSGVEPELNKNKLAEIIEKDPSSFVKLVEDPLYNDKLDLIKAINAEVVELTGVGSGYEKNIEFDGIKLGYGLNGAISFLRKSENQEVYMAYKSELKAKLSNSKK